MSGNAYFAVQTSPVGANTWSTVYNTGQSYDGFVFSVNVPTGEMKLVYSHLQPDCYANQKYS